jgi:hypothetical protein
MIISAESISATAADLRNDTLFQLACGSDISITKARGVTSDLALFMGILRLRTEAMEFSFLMLEF